MLDTLAHADVTLRPCENQKDAISFDDIMSYTSHLRLCSTIVIYLSERCLRQFGILFEADLEWMRYMSPFTELYHMIHPTTYPSDCWILGVVLYGISSTFSADWCCTPCSRVWCPDHRCWSFWFTTIYLSTCEWPYTMSRK